MASFQNDYSDARLINRILTMYYVEGNNQSQVAKTLGLSPAKVNRLIKQAREQGLVEITIHTPFQHNFSLEERLRKTYNLPDPVVIPQPSEDQDAIMQALGRAAGDYLLQNLRDKDIICISGGKAIYQIVQALEPKRKYDVKVVPATGGVQGRHYTDVNYLAAQLADKLGGKAYQLHAPIFVDSPEERKALMSVRKIREILDLARQAQIALVGVGAVISETASYFDLTLLGEADQRKVIEDEKGQGELFAHIYNAQGRPCALEYNQRVFGLSIEDLKTFPLSIGVAATSEKILPIRGALKGEYLKTLITDEATALGVLELDPTEEENLSAK